MAVALLMRSTLDEESFPMSVSVCGTQATPPAPGTGCSPTAVTPRGCNRSMLRNWSLASSVVVAPAALFSRDRPLWRDEVATAVASDKSWASLAGLLQQTDGSNGLYYALMHPLRSVTTAEVALRAPSLIAMAVAAALVAATAHRLTGRWYAGAVALLLLAGNLNFWLYGTEARPSAVVMATTAAMTYLLLTTRGRPSPAMAVAYGALATASLHLQATAGLFVLAHAVVLLSSRFAPSRRRWGAALAIALLLAAPFLLFARTQSIQTSWIPFVTPVGFLRLIQDLLGDGRLGPALVLGLVVVGGLLALVRRSPVATPLVILAVFPVLGLGAAGFFLHILLPRYILFVIPALVVLAAVGYASMSWAAQVPLLVLALVAVGLAAPVVDRAPSEDLRAAAAYLAEQDRPGDGLLYAPDWARVGLAYYADDSQDAVDDGVLRPQDTSDFPGLYVPLGSTSQVRCRVGARDRVWVGGYPGDTWRPTSNSAGDVAARLPEAGFTRAEVKRFGQFVLERYERRGSGRPATCDNGS